MLFRSSSFALVCWLVLIVGAPISVGVVIGNRLRSRSQDRRESLGVVQGALLGLIGLLLAFGLTMAVGRYEDRRDALVAEANTIGTTYLRAQMLPEPQRSESLDLLREYGDAAVAFADAVPNSAAYRSASTAMQALHSQLWAQAGAAMAALPQDSAPRLYVETLNEMIDAHANRLGTLRDRVPDTVVLLQVAGSALTLGVLALYLAHLGKGFLTSALAGVVVVLILLVSFDLDRPRRGFITVPATALVEARSAMDAPPAVPAP